MSLPPIDMVLDGVGVGWVGPVLIDGVGVGLVTPVLIVGTGMKTAVTLSFELTLSVHGFSVDVALFFPHTSTKRLNANPLLGVARYVTIEPDNTVIVALDVTILVPTGEVTVTVPAPTGLITTVVDTALDSGIVKNITNANINILFGFLIMFI